MWVELNRLIWRKQLYSCFQFTKLIKPKRLRRETQLSPLPNGNGFSLFQLISNSTKHCKIIYLLPKCTRWIKHVSQLVFVWLLQTHNKGKKELCYFVKTLHFNFRCCPNFYRHPSLELATTILCIHWKLINDVQTFNRQG